MSQAPPLRVEYHAPPLAIRFAVRASDRTCTPCANAAPAPPDEARVIRARETWSRPACAGRLGQLTLKV